MAEGAERRDSLEGRVCRGVHLIQGLGFGQWTRCREWSQPAPRSSGIRVGIDHFPKSCGPPEYHLKSIKRLRKKKQNVAMVWREGSVGVYTCSKVWLLSLFPV